MFNVSSLRYWVVTRAAPRIAAQDAPDGQCQTFDGTMLDERLPGIFRACGCESARGWGVGRDAYLIEADGQQHEPYYDARHFSEQGLQDVHSRSLMCLNSSTMWCSTEWLSCSLFSNQMNDTTSPSFSCDSIAWSSTCLFFR